MIYIYCTFSIFFLTLALYYHSQLLFFRRTRPAEPPPRSTLEHDDFLNLLGAFNYANFDGVCHGFTLAWAQEAALGLDDHFYDRLNLIKQEKESLVTTLPLIAKKIKAGESLSRKEQKLNEIRPFLESLCLAQSPDEYAEFYSQAIQQSHLNIIFKMIRPNFNKRKVEIKKLYFKTMSFASPQEVNDFLNTLNAILSVKNQIAIICSCDEHTLGFKKYHHHKWLFMDINKLYVQSEEYPYRILTSKELCSILYPSLFESSQQLALNCDFVGKTGQTILLKKLKTMDNLYPVNPIQVWIRNCRDRGILALSVQHDNDKSLEEILHLHHKSPIIHPTELRHALFYAAACNQLNKVRQLLQASKIDINSPCNDNDESMLGVACKYGNTKMVRLLLRIKSVDVNVKNAKNMTPLMLACKSPYTENKPKLFRMLLASGADANLTTAKGLNAYDMALVFNNKAALTVLKGLKFSNTHQYKDESLQESGIRFTSTS